MVLSEYIVQLLQDLIEQRESEEAERERWLAEGRTQYTPEVCSETLQINEEFPIKNAPPWQLSKAGALNDL